MPIHIRAGEGDVAERVVIVGDPARARQLSGLLTDVKVVNENRGFITYTGTYGGVRVTVATHGVGAPSAAIVIEELIKLGAKLIIRLGTTGALRREIGIGDVIVPTGSAYNSGGIYMQYLGSTVNYPAVPNYDTLTALVQGLRDAGVRVWIGPVYSSDAFYAEEDLANVMGSRGILGVEMETAILFLLKADSIYEMGARGWLWIKYKRDYRSELTDTLDLVVVGAFWGRGKRAGTYGALLIAAYDPKTDQFYTVSKVGSGFTDEDLVKLRQLLDQYRIPHRHPRVVSKMEPDVWFVPAVVLEIIGAEITLSPLHTCCMGSIRPDVGLAIRFPRFTGRYRTDKSPEQATTVDEILEMYKEQKKVKIEESANP